MSVGSFKASPSGAASSQDADRSFANPAILAIVLLLGVSYSCNSMDRLIFPSLLVSINKDYGLSLAQGGFLSNSFTIVIAVFAGTGGWCMARVGRKATLVGGLIAYSICTFLTPLSTGFYDIAAYRSLTGSGEAFQLVAIWAIVGAYFGPRRGTAMGILNAMYGVGAFLGPMLGTRIAESFGTWRVPFYFYGIGGIVIALALIVFVPSSFTSAVDREIVTGQRDSKAETGGLFNRNSILLAIAFGLDGWSIFAFLSLYPAYLREALGYSVVEAGTAFGMYGIGTLTALLFGWLGDRLKRPGHLGALALLTINSYVLFHGHWPFWMHASLSLVEGALVSGYLYPRFVAVVQRSIPPQYVGYGMSLLLPCHYVPGLFSGLIFGWLVAQIGWGYASILSTVLPAALAFAVVCFYDPRHVRGEA